MKNNVMLSICSRQCYLGQEPDTIELVTEARSYPDGEDWVISYDESDLTGLQGVVTTLRLGREEIVLQRTGRLQSEMVFREGFRHESLYQMEFGAMMMTVTARNMTWDVTEQGGTVKLTYAVEIEHNSAGTVEYQVTVKPM